MLGDHRGADLFRVPVRGQVGARVEDLAAAGREGDEAVERDGVADRPGRDHHDDPEHDDARRDQRAPPLPPIAFALLRAIRGFLRTRWGAGGEALVEEDQSGEEEADRQVLGADEGEGAEGQPRHEPAPRHAEAPSAAQGIAGIAPARRVAASGSVISIPVYSIVAG